MKKLLLSLVVLFGAGQIQSKIVTVNCTNVAQKVRAAYPDKKFTFGDLIKIEQICEQSAS